MKLGKSTDSSSATHVYEIANRLETTFPYLEQDFRHAELEIFLVFRCLPRALGRKTTRRYAKAENVLYLDMTFAEEELLGLTWSDQESVIADVFFAYLEETLQKYRFAGLDASRFVSRFREVAREQGWGHR
ncbi:MAG TPA: hypothetical protein H9830_15610 [Candidatus Agrococcus pullicola]|uniref:Uncharacterized protein n=1 Tax=Candidatus Agrococcus pullicola TaxID=2838429 RepID=A0A9D1YYS8_9MICO|nr:hypothetical protein [Candidatus Agrococcus pullicola]